MKAFTVRIDDDVYDYLARLAERSKLSVNRTMEVLAQDAKARGVTIIRVAATAETGRDLPE
jgi:predicted transcriptional regulator